MQNHIKISPETIDSNVPEMNFHWFTIKICVKAQPFHPKSLPLLKNKFMIVCFILFTQVQNCFTSLFNFK